MACLFISKWFNFYYLSLDLELSDFITTSPCLTTRTPGQLLSLTSHLTFGSGEPKFRTTEHTTASYNLMNAINRQSMDFYLVLFF